MVQIAAFVSVLGLILGAEVWLLSRILKRQNHDIILLGIFIAGLCYIVGQLVSH